MIKIWGREQIAGAANDHNRAQFNTRKRQTLYMLIFVTLMFGLSYLPFQTYLYMMFFTKIIAQKGGTCYATTAYSLAYWMAISSCAINPFVYITFNAEFRLEAQRYWRIFRTCGRGQSEVDIDKYGLGTSTGTDSTNLQDTPQNSTNDSPNSHAVQSKV